MTLGHVSDLPLQTHFPTMRSLAVFGGLFLFAACMPMPPIGIEQTILSTVASPSGDRELVVVRQDPGATSPVSTAVFVRKRSSRDLGTRVFVANRQPKIEVRWQDDRHAVIAHQAKPQDVFLSEEKANGVLLQYEVLNVPDFLETMRRLQGP